MNEYDSVQPGYENGPKEVNKMRRITNSIDQSGKLADMTPQKNKKVSTKSYYDNKTHNRHKEHR